MQAKSAALAAVVFFVATVGLAALFFGKWLCLPSRLEVSKTTVEQRLKEVKGLPEAEIGRRLPESRMAIASHRSPDWKATRAYVVYYFFFRDQTGLSRHFPRPILLVTIHFSHGMATGTYEISTPCLSESALQNIKARAQKTEPFFLTLPDTSF